jgi:uncharacterized protein (DUF2235 family)
MAFKRIIVCCDGTWNDADSAGEFTNVVRTARAILPVDVRGGSGIPQIVYYQSGVGTGADLVERVLGGSVGLGLSRNVRDGYGFIASNLLPRRRDFPLRLFPRSLHSSQRGRFDRLCRTIAKR